MPHYVYFHVCINVNQDTTAVSRVHDGPHHQFGNAAAVEVVGRSRDEGGFARNKDGVRDLGPSRSRQVRVLSNVVVIFAIIVINTNGYCYCYANMILILLLVLIFFLLL